MKGRKWKAVDGSIELETNLDDVEQDDDLVDDVEQDDLDELVERIERRAV